MLSFAERRSVDERNRQLGRLRPKKRGRVLNCSSSATAMDDSDAYDPFDHGCNGALPTCAASVQVKLVT